jgi:hypothetical protein
MNRWRAAAIAAGLVVLVLFPASLRASAVGQVVLVEGDADLSRGGQPPAVPLTVRDAVAVGDVVRTKSSGRVQIKFVDNSVLTIAPNSRVAVEEYMFDPARGDRRATLEVFRGLVHTSVDKVDPNKPPDFFMKTHTAVLGVRGTKWYTKLLPKVTEVYTEGTLLEVSTRPVPIETEIREVGTVLLKGMEFTQVGLNRKPTPPVKITPEILKGLEQQLKSGGSSQSGGERLDYLSTLAMDRLGQLLGQDYLIRHISSGFYVPPRAAGVVPFAIEWLGYWSEYPGMGPPENVVVNSFGFGHQSPFFSNSFMSEFEGLFQAPSAYDPLSGQFTAKATGSYRLVGGRYLGVMQVTFQPSSYYGGNTGLATLSGPFVFTPTQNLLTATLKGPYQLYTGDRVDLKGVLRQHSHGP